MRRKHKGTTTVFKLCIRLTETESVTKDTSEIFKVLILNEKGLGRKCKQASVDKNVE